MKTPALLLAAALALWGYASSHWLIAALLAAGVLLPTILRLKFDLEDRELNRAADLSSLLTAGAFIYFLSTSQTAQALFSAASWLPACLYPLLLAALFGRQPLRRRHLFYTLRRSQRPQAQREIDVTPLYFATTVLAAGVAPQANPWFYPGLCGLLILWIFFSLPGPRWRRSLPFIPLAALAGELGFLGAGSLQHTQQFLQEWYVEQLSDTSDDPYRSQTRIGDLGNIKLSDRIIWRVAMPGTTPLPLYLRDGVFTAFDGQAWNARRDSFKPFSEAKTDGGQQLEIAGSSRKGQALLALPQGTRAIEGLPASIEHNSYGIVRLKEAPDWLRFTVRYSTLPDSAPPDAGDLIVARHYTNLFARIPAITALAGGSELDKLRGVEAYFANQFRYTLALGKDTSQNRDIERFLLHDKAGHILRHRHRTSPAPSRHSSPLCHWLLATGIQRTGKTFRCPPAPCPCLGRSLDRRPLATGRHHALELAHRRGTGRALVATGQRLALLGLDALYRMAHE
ncbi:MAG: transglutaminase domain protein [Proteobacteria bacterium]|nr:transglutaminase domain protein [Pseudomonadota bacterium]